MEFLATPYLWDVYEAPEQSVQLEVNAVKLLLIARRLGTLGAGAIALVLVSPHLQAKIYPDAGTAYVAPPYGYNLNVRSGPGTRYPAVNTLPSGTPITTTGFYEYGWAQLIDRSWVAGNYINSNPAYFEPGSPNYVEPGYAAIAYIAPPPGYNVNIRSGPGVQYAAVNTLARGTAITITGRYQNGWAQLIDGSWVAGNLIRIARPVDRPQPPPESLREGSQSPMVIEVELRLADLGYVTDDFIADTYYGSDTAQAIRNFQQRNRLPIDGVVDQRTREVLFSESAIPAYNDRPPSLSWQVGSRDSTVVVIEERLLNLGYFTRNFTPDEYFGTDTAAAVRNFQRRNALPIDGFVDRRTYDVLLSNEAIPANNRPSRPSDVLQVGSREPAVRELEERLLVLNYLPRNFVPDTYYDTNTEQAIRNFQRQNRLIVDGVADRQTRSALYSSSAIPNNPGGDLGRPPVDPERPDPGETRQVSVNTDDGQEAIIFSGPGTEYELLGFIADGTLVTITGRTEGNWSELADNEGWIYSDYLDLAQ